jgi:hypothetical protein
MDIREFEEMMKYVEEDLKDQQEGEDDPENKPE